MVLCFDYTVEAHARLWSVVGEGGEVGYGAAKEEREDAHVAKHSGKFRVSSSGAEDTDAMARVVDGGLVVAAEEFDADEEDADDQNGVDVWGLRRHHSFYSLVVMANRKRVVLGLTSRSGKVFEKRANGQDSVPGCRLMMGHLGDEMGPERCVERAGKNRRHDLVEECKTPKLSDIASWSYGWLGSQ